MHYTSADDAVSRDRAWLEAQWELGRLRNGTPDESPETPEQQRFVYDWKDDG
jgi:hypothetical protein